ncbi:DEKNAAC101265, partial [Brettanomyces naardenensis]
MSMAFPSNTQSPVVSPGNQVNQCYYKLPIQHSKAPSDLLSMQQRLYADYMANDAGLKMNFNLNVNSHEQRKAYHTVTATGAVNGNGERRYASGADLSSSLQTSTGTTPTLTSNTLAYTKATSTSDSNLDLTMPLTNPYLAVVNPPGKCYANVVAISNGTAPKPTTTLVKLLRCETATCHIDDQINGGSTDIRHRSSCPDVGNAKVNSLKRKMDTTGTANVYGQYPQIPFKRVRIGDIPNRHLAQLQRPIFSQLQQQSILYQPQQLQPIAPQYQQLPPPRHHHQHQHQHQH